jgi:hypothetical protein
MKLENGTYLVLSSDTTTLAKIETGRGYWVAELQTTLEDIQNGDIIGIWTDKDTDKTWLDKSRYFDNLDTALFWAKRWNQLAIWDNANSKEIRL